MSQLDPEFLERLRQQDSIAFRELVENHQDQVYGLCFKMIKAPSLAEDAAQEVFIKVFRKIRKFDGRAQLSTWIYRMAYNHCIDLLRKRKKTRTTELEEDMDWKDWGSPDSSMEQDHKQYWLNWALDQLKEKDQAIIQLFYIQELPVKEVSVILRISESNVKVKLHRIREKLAVLLKKHQASIFEL